MFHSINHFNFTNTENQLDDVDSAIGNDYYIQINNKNNNIKSNTIKFTSIESNYPYFSSQLINGINSINSNHLNEDNFKKDKKEKKKLKDLKNKYKKKDETKKYNTIESRTYLSSNTLTSDDDSDDNDVQKNEIKEKNFKKNSIFISKKESLIYSTVQNVLLPSIIKGSMKQHTTNDSTIASSTDSSKSNTIEKAFNPKKSIKSLKESFSFKKLATKISSSAGVLKDRLNNKRNSNTNKDIASTLSNSIFYSDIISADIDIKKREDKESKFEKPHCVFSSDSDDCDDLNSAISITNNNFSEKSSINLNECSIEINSNDGTIESYYSKHDVDFFLEEEDKTIEKDYLKESKFIEGGKSFNEIDYEKEDIENFINVRLQIKFKIKLKN
jgi:hypothetical protein